MAGSAVHMSVIVPLSHSSEIPIIPIQFYLFLAVSLPVLFLPHLPAKTLLCSAFMSAIRWLYTEWVDRLKAQTAASKQKAVIKMFSARSYHNSEENTDGSFCPISRNVTVVDFLRCCEVVHAKHRYCHQPKSNNAKQHAQENIRLKVEEIFTCQKSKHDAEYWIIRRRIDYLMFITKQGNKPMIIKRRLSKVEAWKPSIM